MSCLRLPLEVETTNMKSTFKRIAEKAEVEFLEERGKRKGIDAAARKAARRSVAEHRENPRINQKGMRADVEWHLRVKARKRHPMQQELLLQSSPQAIARGKKAHPQREWRDPE